MKHLLAAAAITVAALAAPVSAQSAAADARFRAAQERFDREYQIYREAVDRYQGDRGRPTGYAQPPYAPAPNYNPAYADGGYRTAPDVYDDEVAYDPQRDYRAGSQYRERTLSADERVYAGYDGRYYCRRSDGTTGLIVGAAGGGVLGNVIDGGRSRTVGTLLGAAAGALAGRAIDQNNSVRCR